MEASMLTLIISDDKGASVLGNITGVSLEQSTGLIGYRQALPHPVLGEPVDELHAPPTIISQSYEIADGDVLVLEAGKLIAHMVTGPQAKRFRPGGPEADITPTVPTFIGPIAPKGRDLPSAEAAGVQAMEPAGEEGTALQ